MWETFIDVAAPMFFGGIALVVIVATLDGIAAWALSEPKR